MSIVVVGSGIGGLYSANLAKMKYPNKKVLVLEREPQFGGLLKSFNYGDAGLFDVGTHMIFETGHPSIDKFLLEIEPDFKWKHLSGDWAGTYWNQKLSLNSSYIDITSLEKDSLQSIIGETFEKISSTCSSEAISAKEFFERHFGQKSFNTIFKPIIKKLFNMDDANELSRHATKIFPFNRFIAFDLDTTLNLMNSSFFRTRFAIPDQFKLPKEFASNVKGYYPAKVGLQRYIDSLVKKLTDLGVEFLSSAQVTKLSSSDQKIDELSYRCNGQDLVLNNVEKIIWSAGIPAFYYSRVSEVEIKYSLAKPLTTRVVSLVLKSENVLGKCHYIYNFESSHSIYRVTNYNAYTSSDVPGYKYSLELLTDEENSGKIRERVESELKEMGLINRVEDVSFYKDEALPSGIPLLSIKNLESFAKIRNQIASDARFSNVEFVGAGSKDGVFFQADIMKDVYEKSLSW